MALSPEEWLKQQTLQASSVQPEVSTPTQEGVGVPAQEDVMRITVNGVMSPEEWAAAQTAKPTSTEAPETTMRGVVGAATRGLAPVATGAALGAILGAPIAGVGVVPGAIAGAGAATLATTLGDPIVSTVNSLLGTKYTLPSQALEDLLSRLGVAEPKTEAERIIQSTVSGAAGAGGMAQAGKTIMGAAEATGMPVTREVARQIAAQPAAQIAGGAGAGAAVQEAKEAGFGLPGQFVVGMAGSMAGARTVAPRTPVQLPSDLDEAARAGIRIMTSDVVPPRTFAQKWMQMVGERIPIAGTGSIRRMQQEQRIEAVKNIARDYGITDTQITAKSIWNDLISKRGTALTKYTEAKNEVIDKITTAQSNRVLGQQMAKEADELTQTAGRLYADQAKLTNRINELQTRDLGWAGQQRIDRLQKRVDEYRQAIDEYNTAAVEKRQLAQVMIEDVTSKAVELPRTLKAIDDQIGELTKLNNPQFQPVINILRDWRASVQNQDLRSIEVLRKQLGEAFKSPELGSVRSIGEKTISSIYRPLVEDMGDFIKTNGDRRDYLKWKVSNARLSDMMDDVGKTALESTLRKGDATPEVVYNMLFSQKPSEVAQLYRNLSPEGRANARTAIIARAVEKAGGIDQVSPDRFANQVRDLGKSINVFFSGDELKRVQGLARVIGITKRASEAGLLPPTGVQNFYAMLGLGGAGWGGGVPGAVGTAGLMGTVGGAARVYESAAFRNMLSKFPQLRPGSAEEAELFKRLMSTVSAQQDALSKQENK